MDSTNDTTDSQATGHKLELSEATTKLAEAVVSGDPVLMRRAADAHGTALNSQATAMAASIAQPLYGRFDAMATQLKLLAEIVTNARQADLNWRTEERETRDAQSTRLYEELDKLAAASEVAAQLSGKAMRLAEEVQAGVADLAGVVNEQGERMDGMHDRLLIVETTPGTYPDLLQGMIRLEQAVKDISEQSDRRQLYLLIAIGSIVLLVIVLYALQYARS